MPASPSAPASPPVPTDPLLVAPLAMPLATRWAQLQARRTLQDTEEWALCAEALAALGGTLRSLTQTPDGQWQAVFSTAPAMAPSIDGPADIPVPAADAPAAVRPAIDGAARTHPVVDPVPAPLETPLVAPLVAPRLSGASLGDIEVPCLPPETVPVPPAVDLTSLAPPSSVTDWTAHAQAGRAALLVAPLAVERTDPFKTNADTPSVRADRLARTLVGDIIAYRRGLYDETLPEGPIAIARVFAEDIVIARTNFYTQTDAHAVPDREARFVRAVNELLGNHQPVMSLSLA